MSHRPLRALAVLFLLTLVAGALVWLPRGEVPRAAPATAAAAPARAAGPGAARSKSPAAVVLRRGAAPRVVPVAADVEVAPREGGAMRDLDDLEPAVRDALARAALDHLHALVDACAPAIEVRQDVGAFFVLDSRGVAELELRPIAPEAGPIAVRDGDLPEALVDCLDDGVWAQDWAAVAAAAAAEGESLAFALTMRLAPE